MNDSNIYSEFQFDEENSSVFKKVIKKIQRKIQEIKKRSSAVKRKSLTGKKKLPTPK